VQRLKSFDSLYEGAVENLVTCNGRAGMPCIAYQQLYRLVCVFQDRPPAHIFRDPVHASSGKMPDSFYRQQLPSVPHRHGTRQRVPVGRLPESPCTRYDMI